MPTPNTNSPPGDVTIPLVHTTYEYYKLFHQFIKLFPKSEKYSLGERIEKTILDALELALRAAYATRGERVPLLKELDAKVQLLKTLTRLAHEIRAMDDKKYLALQEKLQEMGKMVGGWLRSTRNNTSAPT